MKDMFTFQEIEDAIDACTDTDLGGSQDGVFTTAAFQRALMPDRSEQPVYLEVAKSILRRHHGVMRLHEDRWQTYRGALGVTESALQQMSSAYSDLKRRSVAARDRHDEDSRALIKSLKENVYLRQEVLRLQDGLRQLYTYADNHTGHSDTRSELVVDVCQLVTKLLIADENDPSAVARVMDFDADEAAAIARLEERRGR